jgi:hypothetical protein
MSNHRVVCLRILALVLPATLGFSCVERDWSVCSPQDQCQTGYTCTTDWKCVRDVDGGADGPVAVDSTGKADGAVGADGSVLTDAAGGPAIIQDGGEPDLARVSAAPDAPASTGPGLDGSEPDRIPVAAPPDAPLATVPDAQAAAGPPDALAPDVPPIGPTVDAAGTCATDKDCPSQSPLCSNHRCAKCTSDTDCAGRSGTLACDTSSGLCVACTANKYCTGAASICDTTTNQCVGCVTRSDCPGVCQTCTNLVCTATKSQDDPGQCAGTCDSTGACRSKQGQTCQTVAAGCAGGTYCSPDGYCCDKACSGSCEACDVAGSLGTCTLVNTAPHKGHAACITSNTVCDGSCAGASTACSYPNTTTSCGSASCSTAGYQGTGTCSAGTCAMPDVVPCPNACVVGSGGCTGVCKLNQVQCSAAGIPQKCNASGSWADQTACQSGYACSGGSCVCSSPNTQCPSGCVNVLGSDANNCGSCGHSCGSGGTCSAGLCQPVLVLSTGAADLPEILGVDDTYVYYQALAANPAYTANAYRVSKSAVGGTAATLALGPAYNSFSQVISFGLYNVLFFGGRGSYSDCSFSSDGGTTCTNTTQSLPWPMIPSKSTTQQHPVLCSQTTTGDAIDWYNLSNGLLNRVSIDPFSDSGCVGSDIAAAYGDTVYWIRSAAGSSTLLSIPFSGSYSSMTVSMTGAYTLLDANARSVLLAGPSGLYRVALPGNSSAQPPLLIGTGSSTATAAIEDANGVYWIQDDGDLNSCTLSGCASGNPKNLANSLGLVWNLFQDDTYLYWTSNTVGQGMVLRLAK